MSTQKKFELTAETKVKFGTTLFRIRALRSFNNVICGELGGWVDAEARLDHFGDAWVYGDAVVYGNARVCDNAQVYGDAEVYGDALVYGNARVCDNAQVGGDAEVYGNAPVCGDARVCDNALVYGNARVYGDARVCDNAQVYGNARVYGNALVCGDARVCGDALVALNAHLFHVIWAGFSITITPQNIRAGCRLWSRFGAETVFKQYKHAAKKHGITDEQSAQYMRLIKSGCKIVPRMRRTKS